MKVLALLLATASTVGLPRDDPTPVVDAGALVISEAAVNHVVNHETGGYAYFKKFCERPIDPKFSSGVTIGFGYDLRFHTPAQVRRDWAGVADAAEITAMCSVCGLDGSTYGRIRSKVRVTWDEAMVVFKRTTTPEWASRTAKAYRVASPTQLHPHLNGALWGNSFNRGEGMTGDRAVEKRQIRDSLAAKRYSAIPALFDAQQKYWPSHARLKQRRREEADLARQALKFSWWQ